MTTLRPRHLLPLLPLAFGLGGCVSDNADSSLIILHMVPAQAGCVFAAGGSEIIGSGTIETRAGTGYIAAPEVRNDLATVDGEAASAKMIFLTGAKVEIDFFDDTLFTAEELASLESSGLTRFQAPFGASVDPDGGTAVVPFEIVPVELIRLIGTKLPPPGEDNPNPRVAMDVKIREIGTRGGSSVESNVFHFPVQVCESCLTSTLGHCAFLPPATPVRTGGFCQAEQDTVTDCCIDDRDDLEVPCAPGETPPTGKVCSNDMEDPEILQCPARPLEL